MERKGIIFTYSILHSGSDEFKNKTPYVIALVEENHERKLSFIEGYNEGKEIAVGTEVAFKSEDRKGNRTYCLR